MPLDRFLNDEDIEESESDWPRPSSPGISDFTREASEIDKLIARRAYHVPTFATDNASIPPFPTIRLPWDRDMWAVRVQVRAKSSPHYRD